MIDISQMDRAAVLAALYNRAQPQGLGILHFTPEDMTVAEARELLEQGGRPHFDYLRGRVMKVMLDGDALDPRLYDRDNGDGAAEDALRTAGLLTTDSA